MKTFALIVAGCLTMAVCTAQNPGLDKPAAKRDTITIMYCAMLMGGKTMVMQNSYEITSETLLNNGSKLSPDGIITAPDGKETVLQNGDCVSQEGIIEKRSTEKVMNGDDKDPDEPGQMDRKK